MNVLLLPILKSGNPNYFRVEIQKLYLILNIKAHFSFVRYTTGIYVIFTVSCIFLFTHYISLVIEVTI